jgi:hypothetical protein
MAKCTECGIEAKSCGCGGSPTSCACGFTEAEIVTKKRMLRREAVILSVENEEMQPVHEFDGLGHWSKCVFC